MVRSDMVRARMTPELKRSAEGVLSSLGILPSQAIVMFYRQIELHHGLPFEVKLPECTLENSASFSDERMDDELERGYTAYRAGKGRSVSAAHAEFRKRHAQVTT